MAKKKKKTQRPVEELEAMMDVYSVRYGVVTNCCPFPKLDECKQCVFFNKEHIECEAPGLMNIQCGDGHFEMERNFTSGVHSKVKVKDFENGFDDGGLIF